MKNLKAKSEKLKVQKNCKGFTLIEILIVLGILVVVGSLITSIFYSSLRGTVKTNTATVLKQNGAYGLNRLTTVIRYGSFEGISPDNTAGSYSTTCSSSGTPGSYLKIRSNDSSNSLSVIACCPNNNIYINGNGACSAPEQLFDTTSSGVRLISCQFTCRQASAINIPVIGIDFFLSQYNITPGFEESTASQRFQTSVSLRNWQ
jgi:prepilin-type N-terminal cleavage/methylation domain-containing protein